MALVDPVPGPPEAGRLAHVRPEAAPPPLRVGVLLNGTEGPRWVASILSEIRGSHYARVVLAVLRTPTPAAAPPTPAQRLAGYWRYGLYNHYERRDRRRNPVEPDAFASVDLSALLGEAKVISVRPAATRFVDRFAPADLECIRAAKLDVLFRFGFRIIKGDILAAARYGVWSFHHDDNREYRGAPPGFWEIYDRRPVCGSVLQILNEKLDGGRIIYRSRSATDLDSLHRTRNAVYWKTARFAARRLRDLHERGFAYLESLDTFNEPDTYARGIYRTPGPLAMARVMGRQALAAVGRRARSLVVSRRLQWFLAVRGRRPGVSFRDGHQGFAVVVPPADRFYADPCLLQKDGATHLFLEDYRYADDKAVISYCRLDAQNRLGEPQVVLQRPYHLSYPFVFEWEGGVFMIPETKANRTIELYRADPFPSRWVLEKVLMRDVSAVDSTLLCHGGRYWLFTSIGEEGCGNNDELSLFWADSPRGPWHPHPRNPIVSDVARARPAGALFYDEGRLIRPAQDCSVRYGHAICFNEVQVLSETDYRESPLHRLGPGWREGNLGTHTYSRTDEVEVVDGSRMWWRFRAPSDYRRALGGPPRS
jgi:hypothetical protein